MDRLHDRVRRRGQEAVEEVGPGPGISGNVYHHNPAAINSGSQSTVVCNYILRIIERNSKTVVVRGHCIASALSVASKALLRANHNNDHGENNISFRLGHPVRLSPKTHK
jgi:hypothetical protein